MTEERKAAERLICRTLVVVLSVGLAVILVPVLWDKLSPFIVAVPIAAMLQPVIRFMQTKLKFKRTAASLIPVLLVIVLLLVLIYWLLSFGITQLINVLSNSGTLIADGVGTIRQAVEKLVGMATPLSPEVEGWMRNAMNDLASDLTTGASELAGKVLGFTVSFATTLPYVLIYVSFLAMGLYFIAKDYENIRSYLPGGKRHNQESDSTRLTNSAIRSLTGYLKVQGTFGAMTWIVSWIYLQCFGFRYAWLIALLAGIMELIPMVGSGLLYIVWSVVSFIVGNTAVGFEVLALTGVLQLVRRILEPKLMSHNIGISPLLSLIGMFVGLRFGGILGLIGGPVIMAVLEGALHGEYFRSMKRDFMTIVRYYRRRWAAPAVSGTDVPEPVPGDPAGGENAPVPRKQRRKNLRS